MKRIVINIWAIVALAGFLALVVFIAVGWSHGFNSRTEPTNLEGSIAMELHDSSIPGRYEKMQNPVPTEHLNLLEAGMLYEQRCAACHGDSGDGTTKFDGMMYPRPTDLRSDDTQGMSDGELYYTINNGIRWSGMPAFGSRGDNDENLWKIVAYVRHLPKLTVSEQQVLTQSKTR